MLQKDYGSHISNPPTVKNIFKDTKNLDI